MQAKVKINFSFAKLASALPKILDKTLSRYARSSAKGAKANIDKGVSPPLKQSTIDIRKSKGITGTKPLFETGNLHRSIKAKDKAILMADYGFKHHKGFITGSSAVFKGVKVPARPFIEPDKKAILTVIDAFKKDINKNFRK